MVDPTPSDYNLTYLRERWERDRSSRIFLQLAEEYRRRGLHAEALEVLETGLGFHPGYLAAQVALGRCRLEAGQPEAAVKVLERVLTQDPTQAVATRLLAESWLQLGDEDRAQAAVDRCRLIGIPPSELAGLDQRLAASRRASRERWQELAEAAPASSEIAAPAAEPTAAEEETSWAAVVELPPSREEPRPAAPIAASSAAPEEAPTPPAADSATAALATASAPAAEGTPLPALAVEPAGPGHVFSLPPRAARGVVLPLRPGAERKVIGARDNPFGAFGRPRSRPPESTEIFRLLPPPSPEPTVAAVPAAPAVSPQPPAVRETPAATPPPTAAPTPGPAQQAPTPPQPAAAASPQPPAADRWWAKPAAEAPAATAPPAGTGTAAPPPQPFTPAPPAAAPAKPAAAPAARWWERPTEVSPAAAASTPAAVTPIPAPVSPTPTAAASPATVSAVHAAPAASAPPPPAAPPASLHSALAATPGIELQASGTIVHPELRPSYPGTATLGELYLRQGYVREAEEIFKQVLARDAENEAALAGLEAIGRKRAQKLTAADLIAGDEESGQDGQVPVRGLTSRKIQLLTRYLGKLRRGA